MQNRQCEKSTEEIQMVKAISDTYPKTFVESRGKTLYHWNVQQEEVTDSITDKIRTQYVYDEAEIAGKVTKAKILSAMRAAEREDDTRSFDDTKSFDDTRSFNDIEIQNMKISDDKRALKTKKVKKQKLTDLASTVAFILEVLDIEYDNTE